MTDFTDTQYSDLANAIHAEMEEYFHDGVSPTIGRYEVDHIIGGVKERLFTVQRARLAEKQSFETAELVNRVLDAWL